MAAILIFSFASSDTGTPLLLDGVPRLDSLMRDFVSSDFGLPLRDALIFSLVSSDFGLPLHIMLILAQYAACLIGSVGIGIISSPLPF